MTYPGGKTSDPIALEIRKQGNGYVMIDPAGTTAPATYTGGRFSAVSSGTIAGQAATYHFELARKGETLSGTMIIKASNGEAGQPSQLTLERQSTAADTKPPPSATPNQPKLSARIKNIKGDVGYLAPGAQDWAEVHEGMELPSAYDLHTGPDSQVTIVLSDGHEIVINEMSQVQIKAFLNPENLSKIELLLKLGDLEAKTPTQETIRSDFSVSTTTAVAGVRGTVFSVRYDARTQMTTVAVKEGAVQVTPTNSSLRPVSLKQGEQVQVAKNTITPITRADSGVLAKGTPPQTMEGDKRAPPTSPEIASPSPPAAQSKSTYPGATPSGRFNGVWKGRCLTGPWHATLVITDGKSAVITMEVRDELGSHRDWSDMPTPYNRAREIYEKYIADSTKLSATDSTVEIWWNEWKFVDWRPKNFPARAFQDREHPGSEEQDWIFKLTGDELIVNYPKSEAKWWVFSPAK